MKTERIDETEEDLPITLGNNETKRYWLIPDEIYQTLNKEFHFDFDPCPYPSPYPDAEGKDGTEVSWGKSNWVNPPFTRRDTINRHGATAFSRKAIAEQEEGKTSVVILLVPKSIYLLLEAGAEIRPLGQISYLEVDTKEPSIPHMWSMLFILRGKEKGGEEK